MVVFNAAKGTVTSVNTVKVKRRLGACIGHGFLVEK